MEDVQFRSTRAGTYAYMSPESLMGNLQGPESDVWALGILLYELHMGKEPFAGKSSSDMLHLISNQPIKFSSKFFSRDAMNLVKSLLKFKPNKRMNIRKLKNSKYVSNFRNSFKVQKSSKSKNILVLSQSPVLQFDPPEEIFTSKFKGKQPLEVHRKSRPKFNNMQKFKSMVEPKNSLYQPVTGEGPQKSLRRISRARNQARVGTVIKPKIHLKKKQASGNESFQILRSETFQSSVHKNRTKERKSFSNQSLGFLSKEEYGTSLKEIQSSNPFMRLASDNEVKRSWDTPFRNEKQTNSLLNFELNPKVDILKKRGEAKFEETSTALCVDSQNLAKERIISQEKDLTGSSENHFIRTNNSDFQMMSKTELISSKKNNLVSWSQVTKEEILQRIR